MAKTAPITTNPPAIVVASKVSPSTTAPSTIATSGLTYWCVTTWEMGALVREELEQVGPGQDRGRPTGRADDHGGVRARQVGEDLVE